MSSTVPFEYRADPGRPPYFTGEGILVRILPDEILGRDPYLVQRRTHRKYRTNKKWAKRYGYVTKYRAFNTIVLHHAVYMTQQSWDALKKRLTERGINEPLFKQQSDREDPGAYPADESDLPSPGSAKVKQRMTGKRSPVDKQQVIRLYRDNHMTYQQIADRVGCAVSTVYGIVSKYNRSAPAPTEPEEPAEETNE